MNWNRWLVWPITLVTAGNAAVLGAVAYSGQLLQPTGIVMLCGIAVAQGSVFLMRRQPSPEESEIEEAQSLLASQREEVQQRERDAEAKAQELAGDLEEQAARLGHREKDLADRFVTFQEWLEFPQPVDLSDSATDQNQGKLAAKDRAVIELLEVEAKAVYERILANHYSGDDGVHVDRIRDEVFELVQKVARIYQPDSSNPLLETSIEQLARSAGRIFLHLLVVLEQLPVDVKSYNINRTYTYIRTGVVSYGAYQAAAPYLTNLSRSLYVGRMIAGTNPLTMGASLVLTELGRRGVQKLSTDFVNRQAVSLLHDFVRVIAFEVAGIYGGDFRYRDPNWIYAAEITSLVSRFPASRESLGGALREVGALQLRNEYDRVYLYRCIADGRVAEHRLSDPSVLTHQQREDLLSRLEKFFAKNIHGTTPKAIERWQNDVEDRFDSKLKLDRGKDALVEQESNVQALHSLAAFLTRVLLVPSEQLMPALKSLHVTQRLNAIQRTETLERIVATPIDDFLPPDLDPSDSVLDDYMKDLASLTIQYAASDPSIEQKVLTLGAYYRRDERETRSLLSERHISAVSAMLPSDASNSALNGETARAIQHILTEGERLRFVYGGVSVERHSTLPASACKEVAILGVSSNENASGDRILLISTGEEPQALWSASASLTPERRGGIVLDDCALSGGEWLDKTDGDEPVIVVGGSIRGGGYLRYFKPLLDFCGADR